MKSITRMHLLVAILTILALAVPAFGGGPLIVNPRDPDGLTRYPNGGANIPYNVDQGGLGNFPNPQQGVIDSFQVWQDVATATATYQNNGLLPVDVDDTNFLAEADPIPLLTDTPGIADGRSPVVLDEDGVIFDIIFGLFNGVLGFASPDVFNSHGVPLESTCYLNGGFANTPGGLTIDDTMGVMVHELGHFAGMAHSVVNGQSVAFGDFTGPTPFDTFPFPPPLTSVETMYPFTLDGADQKTLHKDDIAFFSFLYPTSNFSKTTGTFEGDVLAPNGSTRESGVNVICRNPNDPFFDAVSVISGFNGDRGEWKVFGLTDGADYVCFVDELLAGGFSVTPASPLPGTGEEEYYNGNRESNDITSEDDPQDFELIHARKKKTVKRLDFILNGFPEDTPLPVGDDGFAEIFPPFRIDFCGETYDSFFINANGNITLGSGSGIFSESVPALLLTQPRIAGWWDDLNPSAGGTVSYHIDKFFFFPKSVTITWENVPEFSATGSNTFSITIEPSLAFGLFFLPGSEFGMDYGSMTSVDGIAGYSCGVGVTSEFETPVDLSAIPGKIHTNHDTAIFEQFTTTSPNDLAGGDLDFRGTVGFRDRFEPNNHRFLARKVTLPFNTADTSKFTEIRPDGHDVDYFRFKLNAGETLIAEVLTGQLDTVMGLFERFSGTQLAFNDDANGLLSRIIYEAPSNMEVALAISTFGDEDFDGDGGAGQARYVLDVFTINGSLLTLGDDDFVEVPLPFSFPYQGSSYNSVFVNSNGNLSFTAGDTEFLENVTDFLNGPPRIAMLWDDFSPNQGGLIVLNTSANEATISFLNVPEFLAGNSSSFAATLHDSGDIDVVYGNVAALDGIVGVTEGNGVLAPTVVDFSAGGGPFSATGTTYQQFTSLDPFDLSNMTLLFVP